MKRLALLAVLALGAVVVAVWPTAAPPPAPAVQVPETTQVSRPAPLPALGGTGRDYEPRLVARLEPIDTDRAQPTLTEQGFAPEATETGLVIQPPEPPPGPGDSRFYQPEAPAPPPPAREAGDTALEHLAPLSATEAEDHGHAVGGSEEEDHRGGRRLTWAPGVSRTEYDTAPPSYDTAREVALPGLPEGHPLLAETQAPEPEIPVWRGAGTDTTRP